MTEQATTGNRSTRQLLAQALKQVQGLRTRVNDLERQAHEPVAILGAGIRAPGDVTSLEEFWELLSSGTDAVAPMEISPDGRRRPAADRPETGRWGGQLDQVDTFDAEFFGLSAAEATELDPQQRLVLEVAWEALENAGIPADTLRSTSTGVFLGLYGGDYLNLRSARPDRINAYTGPGTAHCIAANRLSYLLDLHGPSVAVDTACSSSLAAVHLAVRALRAGDCDVALVGGVHLILSPFSNTLTEKVLPMAPGGRCRTFDAGADGIVRAEGCGVLVLQRVSDAERAGRRVRGLIRGSALNHNGRTNGLTAPTSVGQTQMIHRALRDAVADPTDVVYVEAHGTGTPLGDPLEMDALKEVYGPGRAPCAVGAVKTNLGHQEAASGITGLIKALLVLEHGEVPANLHLDRRNPEIDLGGSRLVLPDRRRPLAGLPKGRDRLAAISSFGFGGANAHTIISVPADRPRNAGTTGNTPLLLPVSARSDAALRRLATDYADRLEHEAAEAFCATAARSRAHHPYRIAVTAPTREELVTRLRQSAEARYTPVPTGRRIGFVFSGQGSQWTAMGSELIARFPVARAELTELDRELRPLTGWSLLEQLQDKDNRLAETEVAQVGIAAVQLALVALWRSWGIEPEAVTGHSMGEIVAACVAGALSRPDALALLVRRARLTERDARGGTMAGIDRPVTEVRALLTGDVDVAAVNAAASTVVSGEREAVETVLERAGALGAKVARIRVEYAFHSPLLDRAAAELAAGPVPAARRPRLALYSTVTGKRLTGSELGAGHWRDNLRQAVLFADALEAMLDDGVQTLVEIGPHPVLLRDMLHTVERVTDPRAPVRPLVLSSLRRGGGAANLTRSLAELYAHGLDVRWDQVFEAPAETPDLPTYPWQRKRYWIDVPTQNSTQNNAAPNGPTQNSPAETAVTLAVQPVDTLTRYVRDHLQAALSGDDRVVVGEDTSLDSLPLDSLVIVELKNRIEAELRLQVPLKALLGGGSPRSLAQTIAGFSPTRTGA